MIFNKLIALILIIINSAIYSHVIFPTLVIEQEIWGIFSWVLAVGIMIVQYIVILTLTKAPATKTALTVFCMTAGAFLFYQLPALLIDTLIAFLPASIKPAYDIHFIGWFIGSIVCKTIVASCIAKAYFPQIDTKSIWLWLAIIYTVATTAAALGYVLTYYIKIA